MSEFYTSMVDMVAEMLDELGKDAELLVSGNPDSWVDDESVVTRYPIRVLETDEVSLGNLVQTLISVHETVLIVSAKNLAVVPQNEHSIVVNGRKFNILDIRPIQPGPIVIYYEIKLSS